VKTGALLLAAGLLIPLAVRGPQSVPRLVTGDYLSDPFMKELQKSGSLAAAIAQAPGPVRGRVEARGDARLVTRGDFAGDCGSAQVLPDGGLEPVPDGGQPAAGAVSVVSTVKFTTSLCAGEETTFLHVGDHEAWIGNVLLGGRYKDARGARYVFGASGQATFGGVRHAYRVPLDPNAARLELDGVMYAWTLERGTLRIFDVLDNGEPAAEPRWSLRRNVTDLPKGNPKPLETKP
jgi:hypothetical protein